MEYTTQDLYWEEGASSWYKTSTGSTQYYFHNDIVSSWKGAEKYWSLSFFEAKGKLLTNLWKKVDPKFVRDTVKSSHYKDPYKNRMEFPDARDCDYGNQASTYESSLGKGDKKRFTLMLDGEVYDEVIAMAEIKHMRRNTFLNTMIKHSLETGEVSV